MLATKRPAWDFIEANLARIFLIYAIPFVLLLAVIMPPFQVADELAHTQRADQISRGKLISYRLGGTIDSGWVAFGRLYDTMWFHAEVKQTPERARDAAAIRWSGPQDHVNFQNTAQYGPLLYLPQVTGIFVGRLADLKLIHTLLVARIINGLVACVICALALHICRRGRYLMFATLLLPMTMSELGSASQDALIISLSLLAGALVSKVLSEKRAATTTEFALFLLVFIATSMARPSQFGLIALIPALFGSNSPWKTKAALAGAALVAVGLWSKVLSGLVPPMPDNLSPSGQLHLLITQPLTLPLLIFNTFAKEGFWLLKTLIGCLGWLDTFLPDWYYWTAIAVLIVSFAAPGNTGPALLSAGVGLTTFIAVFLLTCVALYLSWTPLAQPTINGMQGRYMLPVLPLLAWAVPNYQSRLAQTSILLLLLIFPFFSLAVTVQAIADRYYGDWPKMLHSLGVALW